MADNPAAQRSTQQAANMGIDGGEGRALMCIGAIFRHKPTTTFVATAIWYNMPITSLMIWKLFES